MTEQQISAQEHVDRPSESLAVEIKRWINPDHPEGQAKIIKSILALRNNNGGKLIIGFDNNTLQPDVDNAFPNVRELFHLDKIQALVAKFASEPFEIFVEFAQRDGQEYPVLIVPGGLKTPVAVKADFKIGDKRIISIDDVYVRTLNSNNTPSSAKVTWKDWPKLMEVFLDNREADIGRFLRRHLSGITPDAINNIITGLTHQTHIQPTLRERAERCINDGSDRFFQLISARKLQPPQHGAWEVALVLAGEVPVHTANRDFLSLLHRSNPQYTGWPVWLVTSELKEQHMRPYVFNDSWEEFIFDDPSARPSAFASVRNKILDFIKFNPNGCFYQRRAFQEDMRTDPGAPEPATILDFVLPVIRTAETIFVGMAFAKAMGCNPEQTQLAFLFKWTDLKGRTLVSWAPSRHFNPKGPAHQDVIMSYAAIPLETPLSAVSDFVERLVQPLFQLFDGFELDKSIFVELTRNVLERRL